MSQLNVKPSQTEVDEVRRLSMYSGSWLILNAYPVLRGRILKMTNEEE
jgi:hypothetical protein